MMEKRQNIAITPAICPPVRWIGDMISSIRNVDWKSISTRIRIWIQSGLCILMLISILMKASELTRLVVMKKEAIGDYLPQLGVLCFRCSREGMITCSNSNSTSDSNVNVGKTLILTSCKHAKYKAT